jgi:hypothetical protein
MDKDQAHKILFEYKKGTSLKDFSEEVRSDPELVRLAVEKDCKNITYADNELLNNREFILDLIARTYFGSNARFLSLLPVHYRSDKEVVSAIVSTWDCESLKDASVDLRNDPDVVITAMFKNEILWSPLVYEFAGDDLLVDKEFLEKCLAKLKLFGRSEKKDIAISLKNWHKLAVAKSKGGDAKDLEDIKIKLKTLKKDIQKSSDSYDRERAHKSLKELISFAKSFSSNPTVMKQLIEIDYMQNDYGAFPRGESVSIVSKKLLEDAKFASSLMKVTKGEVLAKLPDAYRSDFKFIKENIGEKTKADSLSMELRCDKQFMVEIAQLISGFQFKDFPDKTFWNDKAFALEVLKIDGMLLEHVSTNLKGDREVVFLALSTKPYSVLYADPKFYKDRDYMGLAIERESGSAMERLREPLISDVDFLLESLSRIKKSEWGGLSNIARDVLKSVPLSLRGNKKLVISCLELNGWSIESVPEEIKYDKEILVAAFKSGAAAYKDLDLKKLLTLYKPAELKTMIKNEFYLKEVLAG